MRWLVVLGFTVACGGKSAPTIDGAPGGDGPPGNDGMPGDTPGDTAAQAVTIFVIPMENKPSSDIYNNATDAPFINGLLATSASASKFQDELPTLDSEPHYVWMEAGTNAFNDITFSNDNSPSDSHSTASTAHLVTQLEAAGVAWMSYQEDINANTCPISSVRFYAPKHDPFVFFKDVAGNPPSSSNAHCIAHHKPYSAFATDLAAGLTGYVFITPNLCDDMHGDSGCASGTGTAANIRAGDTWLSTELPRIIDYTKTHDRAVIFITWDEGDSSNLIPFIAIGNHVKAGVSGTTYSHSSLLKSVEEMLGVPVLPTVTAANDFADMFVAGTFP
jgi:phosphatidylinositol-3-phosphatase